MLVYGELYNCILWVCDKPQNKKGEKKKNTKFWFVAVATKKSLLFPDNELSRRGNSSQMKRGLRRKRAVKVREAQGRRAIIIRVIARGGRRP